MSEEQIEALRAEAVQAGDTVMVVVCDAALDGDEDAIRRVERAIQEAAAMDDGR